MDISAYKISDVEIEALRSVQAKCFEQSAAMGWHKKPREAGTMIALIHSEISEALEAVRKDLNDDHLPHRRGDEVEMADAVIRIFDYAGKYGLDVAGALAEKHSYNAVRADHKAEARAEANGKQF